jgi:hypothetical protein
LPCQVFAARRCHFNGLQRADILGVFQTFLQALGVAADDHQQIVEVVGDAAGQLTDRIHFL